MAEINVMAAENVLCAQMPGQLAAALPATHFAAGIATPALGKSVMVFELEFGTTTKLKCMTERTGEAGRQMGHP